jgi:phosphatidate cytidylyltransferase
LQLTNTTTRILVALIAIPFFLVACYWGGYSFLALALFIGLLAEYELLQIARKKSADPSMILGFLAVAAFIMNAFFHFLEYEVLVILIVLPIVILEMFRNKGSAVLNTGTSFLGLFYIGISMSSLVLIREYFTGPDYLRGALMVFTVFAAIWVCDSAAYFGGLSLGKHRLFPRVSPKKSWEGAIFGFVFALLAVFAAKFWLLGFLSWGDAIVLGLIIGIMGQLGDLAESWLKRDAGIKDSSNLIPGHGGIFDRFDSLIAVAPLVYVYLKLFVKS